MERTLEGLEPAIAAELDHFLAVMRAGKTERISVLQLSTLVVAILSDSAPATLDTLNELAAALGDDPNFATTVTNALALKADTSTVNSALALKANLASPALTGTPTAPTAALNTSTTQIATTAFVQANAKGYRCTVFTSSGTWTKPAGLVRARILVIGGGGGGGGVGTAAFTKLAGGGGGAGWSISEFLAAALGATEAVTIGAGGLGVSGANGGDGADSSFGSLVIAKGGLGGLLSNSGTPGLGGGVGGSANVGDRKGYGQRGAAGGLAPSLSGDGGSSFFGGCTPGRTSNGDGLAAYANTGTGGSGAVDNGTTARAGGTGGSGVVIVEEFF